MEHGPEYKRMLGEIGEREGRLGGLEERNQRLRVELGELERELMENS
jgi:hypothetical protein